jgi:SAM-dependent methyltransferase
MKNVRRQTIKFYDGNAQQLRQQYEAIGTRDGDISLGFSLAGNPEAPRVLEIGCSYGREAACILQRTPFYTGIDASEEFIKLARTYVPHGRFVCADAVDYEYYGRYDIVFSFAALRHLDQDDMATVLSKIYNSLRPGGIVYLSLNYGRLYMEQMREDALGKRTQYLYNPDIIMRLAGQKYMSIYQVRNTVGHAEWFEIVLQKQI